MAALGNWMNRETFSLLLILPDSGNHGPGNCSVTNLLHLYDCNSPNLGKHFSLDSHRGEKSPSLFPSTIPIVGHHLPCQQV